MGDVEMEETMSVEVEEPLPGTVTFVGSRDAVSPTGEIDAESERVPENWCRLLTVIVELPEFDDWIARLVGLPEMLKSGAATFTVRTVL